MRYLDISEIQTFESRKRARLINCLTGHKSANLVGTQNTKGATNLSIVSSAVHIGADPALMGIVFRPDSSPRHTLNNIRQTKVCTLNHISEELVIKGHQTSARYPEDVSEFNEAQLTPEVLNDFKAPFVKESKLKIALKLVREIDIVENGTHFLLFAIEGVYLPDEILGEDGHLDLYKISTTSITGLDGYSGPKKLGRLTYAKPGIYSKWLKE
jgi:flavin reductase (DIM6/NTAB) family NADH-FMN oxidoreductase RutF